MPAPYDVMGTLRELSHTADVGFGIEASTAAELLELAAEGLARSVFAEELPGGAPEGSVGRPREGRGTVPDAPEDGPAAVVGRPAPAAGSREEPVALELSRPDGGRLLVAWLRELLPPLQERGLRPRVRVRSARLEAPASLRAEVVWVPATGPPRREIKGVTYHGLEVVRREGRWHVTVVLDV